MNKTLKAAIAAVVLAGAASGARADLTYQGAVGLPLNPTAQIPQPGGIRLQANYFDQGDIDAGGANIGDVRDMSIVAAGRVAGQIELNGGYKKFRVRESGLVPANSLDPLDESGFVIGAKYLFSRESDPVGVRIAAGVGHDRATLRNTHAYVVGTKYLGALVEGRVPTTVHLGLRYDRFRLPALPLIGGASDSSSKVSVYGGVEFPVADSFALVGELQSKNIDGGKIPYSASVRFRPQGQPFAASIGIARQGITGDNGLFAQLGYTFGG
ncbi:MAG TPA: hypothetical protein VF681_06735 [Abditibacteriaceae bacterium]|jgi:hypothetical protein